uniref:Uncharacterized protein n=1 Tax=Glossina palpalis gambiensis TaxID=67801 RepID=A0A1B0BUP6_9MUSC
MAVEDARLLTLILLSKALSENIAEELKCSAGRPGSSRFARDSISLSLVVNWRPTEAKKICSKSNK